MNENQENNRQPRDSRLPVPPFDMAMIRNYFDYLRQEHDIMLQHAEMRDDVCEHCRTEETGELLQVLRALDVLDPLVGDAWTPDPQRN